jgi:hypothetical protein
MKNSVFSLIAMGASILWLLATSFTMAAFVRVVSAIEKVRGWL